MGWKVKQRLNLPAFLSAIAYVWSRSPIPTLIFIASVAKSLSERFAGAFAICTWLWWGRIINAVRNENCQPPINLHVTATADNQNVAPSIIASVTILVVAFRAWLTATFTGLQRIFTLCASAFGLGAGSITFPGRMIWTTSGTGFSQIAIIGTLHPASSIVDIASFAHSKRQLGLDSFTQTASTHAQILPSVLPHVNVKRFDELLALERRA